MNRALLYFGFLLAFCLVVVAGNHAAPTQPPQKKRVEEEEERPAKPLPKRTIRPEDEDANPKRTADLAQLARQAQHSAVQQLYRKLAVPFDKLTPLDPRNGDRALPTMRIEPVPFFYGDNRAKLAGALQVVALDDNNKAAPPVQVNLALVRSIQPYELVALDELDRFRKGRDKPEPYQVLLAEDHVLSAVLQFHDAAKKNGRRTGDGWSEVESRLRPRLRDVLLAELAELTNAKDWDAALTLALRLADAFPGEADQNQIAPRILELLRDTLAANKARLDFNPTQMRSVQQRLRKLIDQFPNNPPIQALNQSLKKQAESLYAEAQQLGASQSKADLERAQELLHRAEDLWPSLEGLQEARAKLRQRLPILRVGIREPLPQKLSPATAVTDAELRAVELMFESLVKFTPDASGIGRYDLGLAAGRPVVIDLGRQFQIPAKAMWSDGKPVDFTDVRATFDAIRDGRGPGGSLAWQNLFAEPEVTRGRDGNSVQVHLNKGFIEPLALMTHKIVPASALQDGEADRFARSPVGSGPFVFDGLNHSEQARPYAAFVANPNYEQRPGKFALPRFREVRFFQYDDAVKEMWSRQLSILLDVTAAEAAAINAARYRVALPSAKEPNRRVYFLAVNHRKVPLNDENLRLALALAINREELLNQHFRGPLPQVHKALNSLYPVNCWASNPELHGRTNKNSCDPHDVEVAKRKFALKERGELKFRLKYPEGDPALAAAVADLAAQVKTVLNVAIEPVAVDARQLQHDLEMTDYELAYCHYDFPDDTFWLGPLFAPRNGLQDNLFGYKSEHGMLEDLLQKSIDYREFAKVQECTRQIHGLLVNKEMPVIPLWQLDPLHAVDVDVKTPPFDPQRVFTDIEKWQLGGR